MPDQPGLMEFGDDDKDESRNRCCSDETEEHRFEDVYTVAEIRWR